VKIIGNTSAADWVRSYAVRAAWGVETLPVVIGPAAHGRMAQIHQKKLLLGYVGRRKRSRRQAVITGVHAIIYAKDAEATRKFFRDVLDLPSVDAGAGWLIFGLPPAELGIHPTEEEGKHELCLLCDNLTKTMDDLKKKGVEFTGPVRELEWGSATTLQIPGGGHLYLYQPKHPLATGLKR